jgi:predicted RNase H-like HicB family nuclease
VKRTEGDTRMQRDLSYTAVFEQAEEGGFVVTFPVILGLATQGETLDEAAAMAEDCLHAYLESLAIDGEPAPYEAPELPPMRRIKVPVAA